jgi:hypothetical protein
MKHALAKSGAVGLAVVLAIQFIPTPRTNPRRPARFDGVIRPRARSPRACFDCHSNDTLWPWYSHVAPASWLVINHVVDGRRHLNFSEWDKPQRATFTEVEENMTRGDMPIWNYVMLHTPAKLTSVETAEPLDGLRATLLYDPPIPRSRPR